MKKLFAILMLLVMLTSCAKTVDGDIAIPDSEIEKNDKSEDIQPENEIQNEELGSNPSTVTETEPEQNNKEDIIIDGYVVNNSSPNTEMSNRDYKYESTYEVSVPSFKDLDQLAELVVIATPKTTYDESEQVWLDGDQNTTDDFNAASIKNSYTKREFIIKQVIKGNADGEITVRERAISQGVKMRIVNGEYIAEKDNEYLLFLKKSKTLDCYVCFELGGKYHTDYKKRHHYPTDEGIFKEVYTHYNEYFVNKDDIGEGRAITVVRNRLEQKTIDTITNFDTPIIEKITLKQNPSIIYAEGVADLVGKEVYKVTFHTKYDAQLGPIITYVDVKSGEILGAEVRE